MKPQLEHITHDIDSSILAFLFEDDHFTAPWHYHADYELTYILKGSGIRHIGNNIDNFFPGDLVLVGTNTPHCWINEKGYNDGVQSVCIQWEAIALQDFLNTNKELKAIKKMLDIASSGIKFRNSEFASSIGNRLNELLALSPEKKLIRFLDILCDLSNCETIELLSVEGNEFQYSEKTDFRTKAILDYLEENYQKRIILEDVADITHLSVGAFCKFFKKQFNRSFTNYLNEFRIRKTCILLQETNDKLSDISFKCGYENMSFFHRQFKKYMNMTPHEYRKTIFKSVHPFTN
ncbi:AraC family transcriptional regulator [Seonamhaeicola marinus]|uniref:AraC family transcriptional regulator n=1 Tax=Seonamhaeicola marinus TaxID=1912246 RepID=A0A5D0H465_9FLAO|nr:AraC family transcriptional regulator [Seonamhaeicola marinus]TYA66015.1 AraC family transcriptional regulator [Seonamhaeicola marinus]